MTHAQTRNRPLSSRIGESLTAADVLSRAAKKGEFTVSWCWKNRPVQNLCDELVQQGKLERAYRGRGITIFHPTKQKGSRNG